MRTKIRHLISFYNESEKNVILSVVKGRAVDSRSVVVEVFDDTPEYNFLTEYLEKNPPQYCFISTEEVFSKQELLSAPILQMVPNGHRGGYPQPEGAIRGDDYLSVTYDLQSGCPTCSKGLLQNRPFRLRGNVSLGKTQDISGIHFNREFIVSRKLKELIESAKLSGCEFWPIIQHGKGIPFEEIFQLKITGELPPMAEDTVFEHDPLLTNPRRCKNGCGATKIVNRVYYQSSDLSDVSDFALTQEWLGANYEYWRWPFMSQRAYRLFLDNKIRGIRYYPPAIVE